LAHIELDLIRENDSSESSVVRVSGSCTVDGHEQREIVGWGDLFALLEKSVTAPES
jgi:hypothetical protein